LIGGEDPSVGSARVSKRQSRFEGSDRQARGRLLAALGKAPLGLDRSPAVMRCDAPRAHRLVDDLVDEGLVVRRGSKLQLP
jgi:A/G-specific adenine glycosylase